MNECNCNCCCAYLNPPWWVTMGFAPPAHFQPRGSLPPQNAPATSNASAPGQASTSAPGAATQGTLVSAPPARNATSVSPALQTAALSAGKQGTSVSPAVPRPTVTKVLGDVATGDITSVISD